ncbi:hypothetical protein CVT26_014463 [Gymnopilus dilepis]|uniref:F-box domain-containing protein n=1 Tax=Gymnopilus dilepis TaxID=231916 RepID=A0A409VVB6_9AGAR|nr:hypothetical protein CVT26_014463 [Gymnopilus dilepis]
MEQDFSLSPMLWSKLPLELIRETLLVLAESSIQEARLLRLVSSDVNVLVLPIIFRHVVMVLPEHVNRFTATLLPKRKNHIPALKSKLHVVPRVLSSYTIDTWVYVVNSRRPSLETALASVAPVFIGLSKLAITGLNLAANAFWLRKHPIHPSVIFIVHHGSPHLVNFYDPIFQSVTHLYTSITQGHRYSTIADLPSLTHLAVCTRLNLPANTVRNLASSLGYILESCHKLAMLVLVMDITSLDDPQYQVWLIELARCIEDQRFVLLPDYRSPRVEWSDLVNGGRTLWDRAAEWRDLNRAGELTRSLLRQQYMENASKERDSCPPLHRWEGGWEEEWEIDLVERDDYCPPTDDPDILTGWMSALG